MKQFKIKLEDKAAFLNRLEKANTPLSSNAIEDNKLEGYFTATISNPEQLEAIKTILKQSPTINTIKENKTMTIHELKEMIRQELNGVISEKKKIKDEEKKEKLDESTELNEADLQALFKDIESIVNSAPGMLAVVASMVAAAKKLASGIKDKGNIDRMTGYDR